MTLALCYDSAWPPGKEPAGFEAFLGYVGGARALRTTDNQEWQEVKNLRQFPCYVPEVGVTPEAQVDDAVAKVRALGWRVVAGQGMRAIIYDLETLVDKAWYLVVQAETLKAGFMPIAYGSIGTVTGNDAMYYWGAHYTGIPALPVGPKWLALQYRADVPDDGTQIDYSVLSPVILPHAGVGARLVVPGLVT